MFKSIWSRFCTWLRLCKSLRDDRRKVKETMYVDPSRFWGTK